MLLINGYLLKHPINEMSARLLRLALKKVLKLFGESIYQSDYRTSAAADVSKILGRLYTCLK